MSKGLFARRVQLQRNTLIFYQGWSVDMKRRRRIYHSAAQWSAIWDSWQAGEPMSAIGRRFNRESSSVFSVRPSRQNQRYACMFDPYQDGREISKNCSRLVGNTLCAHLVPRAGYILTICRRPHAKSFCNDCAAREGNATKPAAHARGLKHYLKRWQALSRRLPSFQPAARSKLNAKFKERTSARTRRL
jgi:hypothetical protein